MHRHTWHSVCVCVYVYIYMCVYMCIYIYIYVYRYICIHNRIYRYTAASPPHRRTCSTRASTGGRGCPALYGSIVYCLIVPTYIYIYIYIYIYTEREREKDIDRCVYIVYLQYKYYIYIYVYIYIWYNIWQTDEGGVLVVAAAVALDPVRELLAWKAGSFCLSIARNQ